MPVCFCVGNGKYELFVVCPFSSGLASRIHGKILQWMVVGRLVFLGVCM